MKIITHGNTYHEIICPICNARIGYTDKEVTIKEYTDVFQEHWSVSYYIRCPECLNRINLKLIIDGKVEEMIKCASLK